MTARRHPIYPQIVGYTARYEDAPPPVFPPTCPFCGAPAESEKNERWSTSITYACGGGYSEKPQIQNHTEYWWGYCKSSEALAILAEERRASEERRGK